MSLTPFLETLTRLLHWQTAADILLMAAGLFLLYRTFLRLGTWKIVAGVLVGKQTFFITDETIRLPRGVNLLDASPSTVALTLAEIIEREIRIRPQFVGKLPGTLKMGSVSVLPDTIRVRSPATRGNEPEPFITTTPIYLESISENTTIYCKIIAPPSVNPVEKRWPDVAVTIQVADRQKVN